MIVSVTALGSRGGDAAGAVARVVGYLDGRCPSAAGRSPQWREDNNLADKAPGQPGLAGAGEGAVRYYADSVEGPGRWLGRGLAGFSPTGEVSRPSWRPCCWAATPAPCVLGPAGSGKTFALSAAAPAWEAAGYVPVGATVRGTATEVLRDATGMACSTMAELLTRLDVGLGGTLSERHVVIVDESSTLGNRDPARLVAHVEACGATLRLVGDPAQHSAVAAGGAWRALLERYPEDLAELVERRRRARWR